MDSNRAFAATPWRELEAQIMDPNVPKNEREHWAAREIQRLRDLLNSPESPNDNDALPRQQLAALTLRVHEAEQKLWAAGVVASELTLRVEQVIDAMGTTNQDIGGLIVRVEALEEREIATVEHVVEHVCGIDPSNP